MNRHEDVQKKRIFTRNPNLRALLRAQFQCQRLLVLNQEPYDGWIIVIWEMNGLGTIESQYFRDCWDTTVTVSYRASIWTIPVSGPLNVNEPGTSYSGFSAVA